MLKKIIILIAVLMILGCWAIYYASSSNVPFSDYIRIKDYSKKKSELKDTLSVMTYNIGYLSGMTNNLPVIRDLSLYTNNLGRAIELIREHQPDIIGFQEIDYDSDRSYKMNQIDSLAIACHYLNASSVVNWDKNYVPFPFWPPTMHFAEMLSGQSIMSSGSIKNVERIVLPKPQSKNFIYNAFYIDRIIQIAKLQISGQELYVMNVHLEAFDQETREAQAIVVREYFEKLASKYPVLLIGDFNAEPEYNRNYDDATMDKILEANDIAHAFGKEQFLSDRQYHSTFNSINPTYKIDYILYNPSRILPVGYEVIQSAKGISDHLPVTMDFVLIDPIEL